LVFGDAILFTQPWSQFVPPKAHPDPFVATLSPRPTPVTQAPVTPTLTPTEVNFLHNHTLTRTWPTASSSPTQHPHHPPFFFLSNRLFPRAPLLLGRQGPPQSDRAPSLFLDPKAHALPPRPRRLWYRRTGSYPLTTDSQPTRHTLTSRPSTKTPPPATFSEQPPVLTTVQGRPPSEDVGSSGEIASARGNGWETAPGPPCPLPHITFWPPLACQYAFSRWFDVQSATPFSRTPL